MLYNRQEERETSHFSSLLCLKEYVLMFMGNMTPNIECECAYTILVVEYLTIILVILVGVQTTRQRFFMIWQLAKITVAELKLST